MIFVAVFVTFSQFLENSVWALHFCENIMDDYISVKFQLFL